MRLIITCCAALLLAIDARGQSSLFPEKFVPMKGQFPGGGVVDVTVAVFADVDGDLDADVMGVAPSAFIVVPASGATFPVTGVAYPCGVNPSVICAADVDGNGSKDAIVLCRPQGMPSQIWTYFNDGVGGFTAPPLVRTLSTQFYTLAVVNLNGDSIPDLASMDLATSQFTFLMGTGGGAYGPEVPLTGPGVGGVFADDDGDGDDDLHYNSPGTFATRRNSGTGTFGAPVVHGALNSNMYPLRMADMNGDGFLDAVFFGNPPSAPTYQTAVQIAIGNGAGGFTIGPLQVLSNRTAQYGPILRDFDGDGDVDVAGYDPTGSAVDDLVLWSRNDGSGSLGPASVIDLRSGWYIADAADVDGDGDCDFGVFFNGFLVLVESAGAPGLVGPGIVPIGGAGGSLMRIADLDRDGRPDAISAFGFGAASGLSIVRDLGSPQAPQVIPIGVPVLDLALGDWSRDGILDLVIALGAPLPGLVLFIGDGAGGFGAPSVVSTGNPIAIQPADANGDGLLDILVLDAQLSVLPGLGGGAFGAPIQSTVCGANCANDALVVGDLNNDGIVDVIVSHPMVGFNPTSTSIHLGNGNGTFTPFAGNPNPIPTAVGGVLEDLNNDRILDFVRTGGSQSDFTVQQGLGNGGFGAITYTVLIGPNGTAGGFGGDIAVGDLNGDGAPDVATARGGVALNDGFGAFTSFAFQAFMEGTRISIADVDRDLQNDLILLQPARNRFIVPVNLTPSTGIGYSYGLGGPGAGGIVPRLSAFGLPQPGGTVTIRIDRTVGGLAPAMILISPTPALIPFGFGYTLLVDPAALQQIPVSLLGPVVPGAGHLDLTVVLPPTPGPFPVAAQAAVFDVASPFFYSVSNGMFFMIQ